MAAPAADGGVGAAARQVAERASALARLELRLALLEVRKKLGALGAGIGLLFTALAFAFFLAAFALAAATAALTLVLPVWAALLTMTGFALLVVAVLGGTGALLLRKGSPPLPEHAIEQARLTTEALRAR